MGLWSSVFPDVRLKIFMKMKYSHETQAIEGEQAICLLRVRICSLYEPRKYESTNKIKYTYLHLVKRNSQGYHRCYKFKFGHVILNPIIPSINYM